MHPRFTALADKVLKSFDFCVKDLPAEIFAEGITAILEALDEGDYGMKPATVKFTLGSTILSIIDIPVIYGILNLFI